MQTAIPDECFVTLPADITPELARSFPDRMNALFRVQLLGRSVNELDSALRLLLELARDLVPSDEAALFWSDEPGGEPKLRRAQGFPSAAATQAVRDFLLVNDPRRRARPLLLSQSHPRCRLTPSLLELTGLTALLVLPIYIGDEARGSLLLGRTGESAFRLEEAHLVRVFTLAFEAVLEGLVQPNPAGELAYLDPSTGLFNRRYFEQQLEREVDRARRNTEPLSVVCLQVQALDSFRNRAGRAAGDGVVHWVTRALRRVVRKSDTISRLDDEHFAVILPRTPKTHLAVVAQRVFEGLESSGTNGSSSLPHEAPEIGVTAVAYPEDAYSPESLIDACRQGLSRAMSLPGRHYYQFPSPAPHEEEDAILDSARASLMRDPTVEPTGILRLFTRLAQDVIPADRVSVMVRQGDDLVIQVAIGFEGQDEIVRTTRLPLNRRTISAWVAQSRKPLLVGGKEQTADLPVNGAATYRGESFFSYPLLVGEELVGIIHFSNRSDAQPFSEADVERFRPVAEFLSRQLLHAREYGRAQQGFLSESLFGLVDLMEKQVPGMSGHSAKVADLAKALAQRLGFGYGQAERIWMSARLHNLGKVSYRSRVLAEPRAFSPRERTLTQRHPLLSWRFLESLPPDVVDRDAILYHHEREDGSGYLHKKAEDVPVSAKILAVADVFEALVSERPYRPAISSQEALAYLQAQKGTLFDAGVVDALRTIVTSPDPRSALEH